MLWKCCTQYASKFGKLNSGQRTGKDQFSFQCQRKAMPKNAQTTAQLHSFHTLVRSCSKSFKLGFNSTWTKNFQMFKLAWEKAEEPEIKWPTFVGSSKNKRVPEKHLFLLYWQCQSLWPSGAQKPVENSSRDGTIRPPHLPPEKSSCRSRNLYTVRTGYGTTDWFQIRKGVRPGCVLSECLFNLYAEYIVWNAGLYEAQAVMNITGRNINHLRCADDTTLTAKSKELKHLLMQVKKESVKAGLKLNIQKTKIMASRPITPG